MKLIKYSELTQSHAPLPTTTRTLVSILRTQRFNSSIERKRLHLATLSWTEVSEKKKRQKVSPQAVRIRTVMSAESGS